MTDIITYIINTYSENNISISVTKMYQGITYWTCVIMTIWKSFLVCYSWWLRMIEVKISIECIFYHYRHKWLFMKVISCPEDILNLIIVTVTVVFDELRLELFKKWQKIENIVFSWRYLKIIELYVYEGRQPNLTLLIHPKHLFSLVLIRNSDSDIYQLS